MLNTLDANQNIGQLLNSLGFAFNYQDFEASGFYQFRSFSRVRTVLPHRRCAHAPTAVRDTVFVALRVRVAGRSQAKSTRWPTQPGLARADSRVEESLHFDPYCYIPSLPDLFRSF
jgi:hypothetical protein